MNRQWQSDEKDVTFADVQAMPRCTIKWIFWSAITEFMISSK